MKGNTKAELGGIKLCLPYGKHPHKSARRQAEPAITLPGVASSQLGYFDCVRHDVRGQSNMAMCASKAVPTSPHDYPES